MQRGTLSILFFLSFCLLVRSAAAQTAKVLVSAPSRSLTRFPAHLHARGFRHDLGENSQTTRRGSANGPRYIEGIQYAKSNKQESVRAIMKWADMDRALAEGSYDMAVSSWSNTGAANPQGIQIAMEEIKMEQKLETLADATSAFDWSLVPKYR